MSMTQGLDTVFVPKDTALDKCPRPKRWIYLDVAALVFKISNQLWLVEKLVAAWKISTYPGNL